MNRGALIFAMFLIALGGGMLHYRIHPPFVEEKPQAEAHQSQHEAIMPGEKHFSFSHALGSIFSFIDIFLITGLFLSRRTVVYGFLSKGMLAIFAIVLMGHFSIVDLSQKNPAFLDWIFKSTLPDIFVALGGFLVGKAIYDSYFKRAS